MQRTPGSPRAVAAPSLFRPAVERHQRTKLYTEPVSELVFSLHKQYRDLSSKPLDMDELKKEVEALKHSSFSRKSYRALINAVEKLMHAYHRVSEGSEGIGAQGYHLEVLWKDLKNDFDELKRTAEASMLSQPERSIVKKLLDIAEWLQMYREEEREKVERCRSYQTREDCWHDDLCVWSTDLWQKACRLKGSTLQKNVHACTRLRSEPECTQKKQDGCIWENNKCRFKALKALQKKPENMRTHNPEQFAMDAGDKW